MVDKHNYSFFGKKYGVILQSSAKNEPFIFLQCVKEKGNGSWEKPSQGEGKRIKCNLEEIIMILQVLTKNIGKWSTYHTFKEESTQISFNWDENNKQILFIKIGDYAKKLNWSQIEILRRLLEHILVEKIENATVSTGMTTNTIPSNIPEISKNESENNKMEMYKEVITGDKIKKVEGEIAGKTDKALLIKFSEGVEVWIPKSTVKSKYSEENNKPQEFFIDSWILEKNKIKTQV